MESQWSTLNMNSLLPMNGKKPQEVSPGELNSLLAGRKFGNKISNDVSLDMQPTIETYDSEEAKELEEYCRARGIIGVNFNGMRPKAVLNMLRGKVEGRNQPTSIKRQVLNG